MSGVARFGHNARVPFLNRVVLKNYKSIAGCDVALQPLTFLVGPNGSGKSNFLDALRIVTDALRTSLDHAIRDRGGINEVRRRSAGHPTHFGIRLEFTLPNSDSGYYAFRIGARPQGGYEVQTEECVINRIEPLSPAASFFVRSGVVMSSSVERPPAAQKDRLYLVNASGLPEFRALYDALSRMGFYNLNPDRIRDLQRPDQGDLLTRDGGNIASVIDQLEKTKDGGKTRIEEYLEKVVPGIRGVAHKPVGGMETLEFRQDVPGALNPWKFPAASMSDGTLRALGILVALLQVANGDASISLVGIEEPEVALHPAAAGVILDALREASSTSQVIVTSHSPDLLDDERLDVQSILAVMARQGETLIAPVDEVGRDALRDHLYTAGELLRLNQLTPDPKVLAASPPQQLQLFGGVRR